MKLFTWQTITNRRSLALIISLLVLLSLGILSYNAVLTQEAPQPSNQPTPTASPNPTIASSPTPTATTTPPSPTPSNTLAPTSSIQPTTKPTNSSPSPTAIPLMTEISRGNQSVKQVIFTFDAGSGNQSIDQILTTLDQYNVEGSFFITGAWASNYANDLKRIAANGHAIYNHTYTHPHLTQLDDAAIKDELKRTDEIIISTVGFDSKPFFRAPYGERDQRVLAAAANQGYRHVYWTIDAWDWKEGITAQEVKNRILNNLSPGTIYLMHVGDAITGQILSDVFAQIRQQGYQINSLNQGL